MLHSPWPNHISITQFHLKTFPYSFTRLFFPAVLLYIDLYNPFSKNFNPLIGPAVPHNISYIKVPSDHVTVNWSIYRAASMGLIRKLSNISMAIFMPVSLAVGNIFLISPVERSQASSYATSWFTTAGTNKPWCHHTFALVKRFYHGLSACGSYSGVRIGQRFFPM